MKDKIQAFPPTPEGVGLHAFGMNTDQKLENNTKQATEKETFFKAVNNTIGKLKGWDHLELGGRKGSSTTLDKELVCYKREHDLATIHELERTLKRDPKNAFTELESESRIHTFSKTVDFRLQTTGERLIEESYGYRLKSRKDKAMKSKKSQKMRAEIDGVNPAFGIPKGSLDTCLPVSGFPSSDSEHAVGSSVVQADASLALGSHGLGSSVVLPDSQACSPAMTIPQAGCPVASGSQACSPATIGSQVASLEVACHELADSQSDSSSTIASQAGSPAVTSCAIDSASSRDGLVGCSSSVCLSDGSGLLLPRLSTLDEIGSLQLLSTGQSSLVIAFDSEWFYAGPDRVMTSWQFAVVYNGRLLEFVFLPRAEDVQFSLEFALSAILKEVGYSPRDVRAIKRYACLVQEKSASGELKFDKNGFAVTKELVFRSLKEATQNAEIPYQRGSAKRGFKHGLRVKVFNDWADFVHIPVTLVCHAGKVDLSALDQEGMFEADILNHCSEVQGGLISLQNIKIYPLAYGVSKTDVFRFPVSLTIRDTMCFAPAGERSLEDLGKVVGFPKVEILDSQKSAMGQYFCSDPLGFLEYASTDSIVTLFYYTALWGYNMSSLPTITSGSAKICKAAQIAYFESTQKDCVSDYDTLYRGLSKVKKGLFVRDDKLGFLDATNMEPVSLSADTVLRFSSRAYGGGYNACVEIGYYTDKTFDYDLANAYPTAMCLVPDVDWTNPIVSSIEKRELILSDFMTPFIGTPNPLPYFVGYITFEFPESVKFPNLCVNVDGIPVYPLTSKGVPGIYASGVEIVLALQLGAKIFCECGHFIRPLLTKENAISYSLRHSLKMLVNDRTIAKMKFGNKSIEQLILKYLSVGIYGKQAQNVVDKLTWNAFDDTMKSIGCSSITNPFSAMMTTAIVRSELIAAMNELDTFGYRSFSVTTDGFISDVNKETLTGLNLYNLRSVLEQSRLFLTDNQSPEIWEVKHSQEDLLNFTTRGNVSLNLGDDDTKSLPGVCAHNSAKSGYISDSIEDREWLYSVVATRTEPVAMTDTLWTKFKNLVLGDDFRVINVNKRISMDFDMKRKPLQDTIMPVMVPVGDKEYETANISTAAYEDVSEFKKYRLKKKTVDCLRTEKDWLYFFRVKLANNSKSKIRDYEKALVMNAVTGHRAGFWNIPKLDALEGEDRIVWINSFNKSEKPYTLSDWKNAGRKTRQTLQLTPDELQEIVALMCH